MTSLTIEHTDAEGTLLVGTARGDGSAQVVKALGWRWGRSIGLWFVPRSRNQPPKRALISRSAEALEAAGFTVAVEVDATVQGREQVEDRLEQQAEQRAGRLRARSQREGTKAEQRWRAGHELADRIPIGQPILLGHHSQRRAERDAERISGHMDASVEHQRRADDADRAARTAEAAIGARNNPVTVANRIERLGAQIRRGERELANAARHDVAGSQYMQGLQDRLAHDRADLNHWRLVRDRQISDGIATNYDRDTVAAGDLVKIHGQWRQVVRANAKTVAVATGYSWTDKVPWYKVAGPPRRRAREGVNRGQVGQGCSWMSTP